MEQFSFFEKITFYLLCSVVLASCGGRQGGDLLAPSVLSSGTSSTTSSGAAGGSSNTAPVATAAVVTVSMNNTYSGTLVGTDADGNSLTYSIVTNGTAGTATVTNANTGAFQYVPNNNTYGLHTFTFKVNDGTTDSNTATVSVRVMTPFTWVGAGANGNWNTALNWYGSVAPNGTQVAVFDGTCPVNTVCNSNKTVAVTANPNVLGVEVNTGFDGSITQNAGIALTVGTSGWTQADGTFTGSNSTITINGTFTFSGGTFTATTGNMNVFNQTVTANGTYSIFSMSSTGATFNHNNGTLQLIAYANNGLNPTFTVDIPATLAVNNLLVDGNSPSCCNSTTLRINGTNSFVASGNFTHFGGVFEGNVQVSGNVIIGANANGTLEDNVKAITFIGTNAQTYSVTGTGFTEAFGVNKTGGSVAPNGGTTALDIGGFFLTQGTFTAPTGTMKVGPSRGMFGASISAMSVANGTVFNHNNGTFEFRASVQNDATNHVMNAAIPGVLTLNNVFLNGYQNCCSSSEITVTGGGTVQVLGDFQFGGGRFSGNWELQGNITLDPTGAQAGNGPTGGSATVTLTGANVQTYTNTNTASYRLPTGLFTINKTGGSFELASALTFWGAGQDMYLQQGTMNMNNINLTIPDHLTLDMGTVINRGTGTITATGGTTNNGTIN